MVYPNFGKYGSEKLLWLHDAAIVQTERYEACFKLPRCSLSYTTIKLYS